MLIVEYPSIFNGIRLWVPGCLCNITIGYVAAGVFKDDFTHTLKLYG
jgi:hypothetical protein